jgi:hypothetical protein
MLKAAVGTRNMVREVAHKADRGRRLHLTVQQRPQVLAYDEAREVGGARPAI